MSLLGVDVSNYTGTLTDLNVAGLVNGLAVKRAIIACQFDTVFNLAYQAFKDNNVQCDAYRYLYSSQDYGRQVQQALMLISTANIGRLWLDFEDTSRVLTGDEIEYAFSSLGGFPGGCYTGAWYWPSYTGNYQLGQRYPLWNALWDGNPEGFDVDYGGWKQATVKQYSSGLQYAGLNLDLDSWNE